MSPIDDLGRAVHDDPVLGAVVVHLHGQLAAGLDVQQLDLEARADAQRLEVAPRTVVAEVLLVLLAVRALEARDDLRDVLRAALSATSSASGVSTMIEILDADGRDERALASGHRGRSVSSRTASPSSVVAIASCAAISHSDDHEPTSLQPTSRGSIAAASVFSITA